MFNSQYFVFNFKLLEMKTELFNSRLTVAVIETQNENRPLVCEGLDVSSTLTGDLVLSDHFFIFFVLNLWQFWDRIYFCKNSTLCICEKKQKNKKNPQDPLYSGQVHETVYSIETASIFLIVSLNPDGATAFCDRESREQNRLCFLCGRGILSLSCQSQQPQAPHVCGIGQTALSSKCVTLKDVVGGVMYLGWHTLDVVWWTKCGET